MKIQYMISKVLIPITVLTSFSFTNKEGYSSTEGSSSFIEYKSICTFNSNTEIYFSKFDVELIKIEEEVLVKLKEKEQIRKEHEAEINRIISVGFNEYNLLETSSIKAEELYEILPDSMKHLAGAIVKSEEIYGVSAFFTTSIIALESSWATSSRAIYSNNLSGMAVYGDDSPGIYYSSQEECVYNTVKQLKENYLSEDGIFYNGNSTQDVNVKYCESSDWYLKINQIAYELVDRYDKIYRK